jgi:CheY-like chemotaxis protein
VVAFAFGGDDAVALCLEHRPDVLVVDYRMPPGPNGLDVAERLRADAPGIAIVLYTNYRGHDLRTRAEKLGVTHLLKGNIRALRREVAQVTA